MLRSKPRWIIAVAVALYLYFLLPETATLFYELYHLTDIGLLYWGYSGFKAAGYYLGISEYRLPACLLVAAAIVCMPAVVTRLRKA